LIELLIMAALSTAAPSDDNTKALSVSSSSMAPEAHAGPSSAARASDLVLSIDNGKFMTLQTSNLVVEADQSFAAKPTTVCGIPFGSKGKQDGASPTGPPAS
jgi:hypothetical protein